MPESLPRKHRQWSVQVGGGRRLAAFRVPPPEIYEMRMFDALQTYKYAKRQEISIYIVSILHTYKIDNIKRCLAAGRGGVARKLRCLFPLAPGRHTNCHCSPVRQMIEGEKRVPREKVWWERRTAASHCLYQASQS